MFLGEEGEAVGEVVGGLFFEDFHFGGVGAGLEGVGIRGGTFWGALGWWGEVFYDKIEHLLDIREFGEESLELSGKGVFAGEDDGFFFFAGGLEDLDSFGVFGFGGGGIFELLSKALLDGGNVGLDPGDGGSVVTFLEEIFDLFAVC